MAENHNDPAQHPAAPPHNRAPQAGQPDLELLPTLTDAFIDTLTKAQAQQWSNLVMPATVASTVRKNCTVKERRDHLKFLRDLKRNVLAQPAPPIAQAAPPIAQPREQQGARQSARDGTILMAANGGVNFGDIQQLSYAGQQSSDDHHVSSTNARDGGNLMANGCFNFGDVQLHAHAADRARAPQQSIDEQFRARFGNYRNRHPFPQSHRNRHFGNYAVDPYRSRGNSHGPPAPYYPPAPAPPPGPAPPGPAPAPAVVAGGGNRPAQAVIDEDAIYSRAAHARRSSPNRDDADAAFAREAGSAARDAHDRLGGQLPRGYF